MRQNYPRDRYKRAMTCDIAGKVILAARRSRRFRVVAIEKDWTADAERPRYWNARTIQLFSLFTVGDVHTISFPICSGRRSPSHARVSRFLSSDIRIFNFAIIMVVVKNVAIDMTSQIIPRAAVGRGHSDVDTSPSLMVGE